jgi:glycerophosphoryl diester phosphodiesterase
MEYPLAFSEGPFPRLIGHRGAAAHAPENTLAGFAAAARLGIRWVEFDVRLTADGRLVLHHDARLGPTARRRDGKPDAGWVRSRTAAQLAAFEAGSWFAPAYAGEPVLDLEAAIAALGRLGLNANIEIKCSRRDATAAATALAAILRAAWPAEKAPPLVSSFDHRALFALRALRPDLPIGLLFRDLIRGWRARAERLAAATVHLSKEGVDAAAAAAVRGAGLTLLVYTVNDPAEAARLFGLGVDALFTDDPAALAEFTA